MWEEIAGIGRKLVLYGLTHAFYGNISVRTDGGLLITCSGSMLDEIDENMVVFRPLDDGDGPDAVASSEIIVHRRIYRQTSAQAVIHVHSPYAVALSMLSEDDYLIPRDAECQQFLQRIPVVEGGTGSPELAANMAGALSGHKAAIVRGHGTFAAGRTLREAYIHACTTEHACMVHYLTTR